LFGEKRFLGEKEKGKVREKGMREGSQTALGKGTERVTRMGKGMEMGRAIAS
jgi:hypothetical protein